MGKATLAIHHPAYPVYPSTFGPAYDAEIDAQRVGTQLDRVASVMAAARDAGEWLTNQEIAARTGDPENSVAAQVRHLRKKQFGGHVVEKRRRLHVDGTVGGTWEYRVDPPAPAAGSIEMSIFGGLILAGVEDEI